MIATGAAPDRASTGVKSRPIRNGTRSSVMKPGVTRAVATESEVPASATSSFWSTAAPKVSSE